MPTEVERLKVQARKAYLSYWAEFDRNKYDCGRRMAEHMNPHLSQAKRQFNEAMDKLSKLDPTCPDKRL